MILVPWLYPCQFYNDQLNAALGSNQSHSTRSTYARKYKVSVQELFIHGHCNLGNVRGFPPYSWESAMPLATSITYFLVLPCFKVLSFGKARWNGPTLLSDLGACVPAVQKICAFSTEATMDLYGKQFILSINPWLSFSINYSPHVEQHHYSISSKNERERSEFEHCLVLRVMEVKRLSLRSIIWLLNYKAAMIVTWIIAPCMVSLTTVY